MQYLFFYLTLYFFPTHYVYFNTQKHQGKLLKCENMRSNKPDMILKAY